MMASVETSKLSAFPIRKGSAVATVSSIFWSDQSKGERGRRLYSPY